MTKSQIYQELEKERRVLNMRSQEQARRAARIRRDILLWRLRFHDYEETESNES